MKKLVLILGLVIGAFALNSCTDNSLEEIEKRNDKQEIKFVDPKDDGTIKDTDPDDDGEG
ncbi:hypothetical protein ACQY1Q_05920 [Tenacibaculum sp. TC6]|uniref:hypothetical protein n=1 Tax=Tenacibaculum sp. TC6 TaxID=3423223 RepID=UPI003D35BE18